MSDPVSTALTVLMVGHSLFGQTGPDMLDAALGEAGTVQAQIINGAPLRYNWENADRAEGVDARALLPGGTVTDLILTEAVPLANHLQWSETEVYAEAFAGLALASHPQARVFVQEGWHSLNSGTGVQIAHDPGADQPWRARLQTDLADWQGIVDQLRAGHPAAAEQIHLIPAGQALARLDTAIAAGQVPGVGAIAALFDDDIHLNDLGHYFVSMVQVASLRGVSPEGLPHTARDRYGTPFAAPAPDTARVMQEIAWQTVSEFSHARPAAPQASDQADRPPAADSRIAAPVPVVVTPVDTGGPKARAVGLAAVTDWSTQAPFLDLMKTARPLFGHLPGRFGGIAHADLEAGGYLDDDGWLREMPRDVASVGTLVLTDMPQDAGGLGGRYVLRFEGAGVVEVTGRAQDVRYGANEVRFGYAPGPGSVDIRIQRSRLSDPVRNITVVREDRLAAFDAGAVFNPDWLALVGTFGAVRFMDWMETNGSTQARWADRPQRRDATWAEAGVPVSVMIDLVNTAQVDGWFNMPHLADDAYVTAFAALVRDTMDPARTAYVEYSNEMWNFQFAQTRWAEAQARALWGKDDVGTQFYARRAAEVARIWRSVLGEGARLVNVISTQTGWLGLEDNILTAPLVQAEGAPAPVSAFDAYAVTGYFGGVLGLEDRQEMVTGWLQSSLAQATQRADAEGLTGDARAAQIADTRFDLAAGLAGKELLDGSVSGNSADTVADLVSRVWPYHAQVAQTHGLDLIMYEGGTHAVGLGAQVDNAPLTAFLQHLNYTPQMGALYARLLAGWQAVGGRLFNAYSDVYTPTKWGSWGARRHLGDDNPRWQALVAP
ncbi:hypothetical protein [Sulfitobacter sp. S190]|uniref:hypothetical protein n=1 Tax=Sulfitobacter sp. S190 TaxID=2867022 RepID=UPI0021A43780|nr:hypothetical protein [Sulfitobacter sp. S190]UWR23516.1 hypothetical protein K3756_05925 [Sulfitobacter sp. S190]